MCCFTVNFNEVAVLLSDIRGTNSFYFLFTIVHNIGTHSNYKQSCGY